MSDQEDDLIRGRIRDFAYAEPMPTDAAILRRRREAQHRRQRRMRLATAAVLALLVGGVAVWLNLSRPESVPPIDPSPSPTSTSSPSPSPTPETAFQVQTRPFEDLPTGGLGDTVEGLRLTSIDIPEVVCGTSQRCPGDSTLTVTNVSPSEIRAFVFFNVWRNNNPATSDSRSVTLAPGESTQVTITTQPMLSDSTPPGSTGAIYSWNFSVELG